MFVKSFYEHYRSIISETVILKTYNFASDIINHLINTVQFLMKRHSTIVKAILLIGVSACGGASEACVNSLADGLYVTRRLAQGIQISEPQKESKLSRSETTRTILEEDFNKFTDGSISEPGAWVPADYDENYMDYYKESGGFIPVPEELTDKPGWLCCGLRQAGGAVYAGDSRLAIGMLITPEDDYYGKVTIRFNARTTSKNNTGVMVFVGDDMKLVQLKPGEELLPYEVTFTRESHEPTSVCIQIPTYTPGKGYILDDLKITADIDFAVAPSNPLAMDFTDKGFTAWWNPSPNGHHYLLDLWEETEKSDEGAEVKEDFSDAEIWDDMLCLPAGWNYDGEDPAVVDDGYENSIALVLDKNRQDLYWEGNGGRIMDFSVFLKKYGMAEGRDDNAYPPVVSLSGWDGEGWSSIGTLYLESVPDEGVFLHLMDCIKAGNNPTGRFTKFRIATNYFIDGDKILIDEVNFLTTPPAKIRQIKEQETVEENKSVMTDLDPDAEYYFRVYTVNEYGTVSEPTQRVHALGVASPTVSQASDIESRGAYTANWLPVGKAQSYTVKNYRSTKITTDEDNHAIITDSFGHAAGDGDIVNIGGTTFINLDTYSDVNGWSAYHGCMADGMLGARGDYNELRSPELTLNNNDGKFSVKMTVYSYPGEILAVQSFDTYETIEFTGEPDALGLVKAEREFTFTDGRAHHQIVFYTLYGDPFLIDDITISQDVKAGDRVMSLSSSEEISDPTVTSHRFSGLRRSDEFDYAFSVIAHRTFYDGTEVSSEPSADQLVMITSSVNTTFGDTGIRIMAKDGNIIATLSEKADIVIFNMEGRIVGMAHGESGENVIPIPDKGIFIISVNGEKYKVIL
jgi:hypothetical protein